jgi:hypothetical protein
MAKKKIMEWLFGMNKKSFQILPKMLLTIKNSNLGMVIDWDHKIVGDNKKIFGRAFWAFGASNNMFQYYCSLISIDGTHMYGKYKAKLLIAVSYNANNRVYLLYFAIVEEEMNSDLDLLCQYIIEIHTKLCTILDRHEHKYFPSWLSIIDILCVTLLVTSTLDSNMLP